MSVPLTIFIDTNIFDAVKYDFQASTVKAFVDSIRGRSIQMIRPEPIQEEMIRHIEEQSSSAINALKATARKHPFLKRLDSWPFEKMANSELKRKLASKTRGAYYKFTKNFEVINLGYDGVGVETIMKWYRYQIPPFSDRKKSEFPDAIALEIIYQYQVNQGENIAVISNDRDFEKACERYPNLMHYPSLGAYSQGLLNESEKIINMLSALAEDDDLLRHDINSAFMDSEFLIEANWDGEVEDPEIVEFQNLEYNVVALGENTATLAFEAEIQYSAHVDYDDLDSATYDGGVPYPLHRIQTKAEEECFISGTIKVKIETVGDQLTISEVQERFLDQSSFTIGDRCGRYG